MCLAFAPRPFIPLERLDSDPMLLDDAALEAANRTLWVPTPTEPERCSSCGAPPSHDDVCRYCGAVR